MKRKLSVRTKDASREERELEKQIAALTLQVAKSRKSQGDVHVSTTEEVPTSDAKLDSGFRMASVFDYMKQLSHLPRATLLRRFEEDIGTVPRRWKKYRDANNAWLRAALARNFQRHHYGVYGIPIPVSVQLVDRIFAMCSPWQGENVEEDLKHSFENDNSVRVIAKLEENTFVEPRFTKFEVIRLAGVKGVSYQELIVKYRHLVANEMLPGNSNSKPEDWAWSAFTSWVDKGITEMIA